MSEVSKWAVTIQKQSRSGNFRLCIIYVVEASVSIEHIALSCSFYHLENVLQIANLSKVFILLVLSITKKPMPMKVTEGFIKSL